VTRDPAGFSYDRLERIHGYTPRWLSLSPST
jgi:hypothetical protein